MTKQFKLFIGNNYGIQSADGEVIIDSIISVGDAEVLCDLLNDLLNENEQLKSENNMLKTTICRNEAYISRMQHKGEWRTDTITSNR